MPTTVRLPFGGAPPRKNWLRSTWFSAGKKANITPTPAASCYQIATKTGKQNVVLEMTVAASASLAATYV